MLIKCVKMKISNEKSKKKHFLIHIKRIQPKQVPRSKGALCTVCSPRTHRHTYTKVNTEVFLQPNIKDRSKKKERHKFHQYVVCQFVYVSVTLFNQGSETKNMIRICSLSSLWSIVTNVSMSQSNLKNHFFLISTK